MGCILFCTAVAVIGYRELENYRTMFTTDDEEHARLLESNGSTSKLFSRLHDKSVASVSPKLDISCAKDDEEHDDDEERDLLHGNTADVLFYRHEHKLAASITPKCILFFIMIAAASFAAGSFSRFGSKRRQQTIPTVGAVYNADGTSDVVKDGTPSDIAMPNPQPLLNASLTDRLISGMNAMLARNNGTKVKYKYDSPYEKRMPGSNQPNWAKKWIPYNRFIPTDKQICFVHVGKAGGSTSE